MISRRGSKICVASLDELYKVLTDYADKYIDHENKVKTRIEGVANSLLDLSAKMEQYPNDDGLKEQARKEIVDVINGSGDFDGMSNLPEIDGYDKVFDKIEEEYRALNTYSGGRQQKRMNDYNWIKDISAKVNSGEASLTQQSKKISKELSAFVKYIDKNFPAQRGSWTPFADAVVNLVNNARNTMNDIVVSVTAEYTRKQQGNDNTPVDVGKLLSSSKQNIRRMFSDLNYYVRAFGGIYGNNRNTPEEYNLVNGSLIKFQETLQDVYEMLSASPRNP